MDGAVEFECNHGCKAHVRGPGIVRIPKFAQLTDEAHDPKNSLPIHRNYALISLPLFNQKKNENPKNGSQRQVLLLHRPLVPWNYLNKMLSHSRWEDTLGSIKIAADIGFLWTIIVP